jgi:hypothetical protein
MDILKRRIGDLWVTAEGQVVKGKFELAKTVKLIKGIMFTSNYENIMCYRGTIGVTINGNQRFEENFESKQFQSSLNVSVNDRFMDVGDLEPGNGIVELIYTDTPHPLAPFVPYRVTLNMKYEL